MMSRCEKRVVATLFWVLSLVIVGFTCWKVAPSEKLTYQTVRPETQEVEADVKVGDRGYVDYGAHKNELATVQAIGSGEYVIKLGSGQTIQVPGYNWIPLAKDK